MQFEHAFLLLYVVEFLTRYIKHLLIDAHLVSPSATQWAPLLCEALKEW